MTHPMSERLNKNYGDVSPRICMGIDISQMEDTRSSSMYTEYQMLPLPFSSTHSRGSERWFEAVIGTKFCFNMSKGGFLNYRPFSKGLHQEKPSVFFHGNYVSKNYSLYNPTFHKTDIIVIFGSYFQTESDTAFGILLSNSIKLQIMLIDECMYFIVLCVCSFCSRST